MADDPEHAAGDGVGVGAVAGSADAGGGGVRRARKANPLANRIKRLMQTDEDVGKIAQASPVLIGRALELFLGRLCSGTNTVAQQYYTNIIAPGHLKAAVVADPMLDFLKDTVADAPELPPPPEEPPARVARQRKKAAAAAAGDGDEAEAAPQPKRQRKPRARKQKADSDDENEEEQDAWAADGSDPDYSDAGAAGKRRQRKRAAPRNPRAPKAAAAADGGRRQKSAKAVEPDVQLSDAEPDEAAGGWRLVSDGAAAAPSGEAAVDASRHPAAAETDEAAAPLTGPAAAPGHSGAEQPAVSPAAPDAAAEALTANGATPFVPAAGHSLPAFAYAGAGLVPALEEDDYDAE